MKNTIYIIIVSIFYVGFYSCKKSIEDPLSDYSEYGIFKDIYPLQDSVTVDLKPGDSTFVETNKGKMWINVQNIGVLCHRGSTNISCPDAGISTQFYLRLNNETYSFYFALDDFPKENYQTRYPLITCKTFLLPDVYGKLKTVGTMNIQLRNIYPNPISKDEYDKLVQSNGFHATLTFQKICR